AHGALPETMEATTEEENGRMQPTIAAFASYSSPATAVSDYTNLIEARFSDAVGAASVPAFAASLQNEGYATDGAYAGKIVGVARSPFMADVLRALGVEESVP
ncbi:MAG: glucosaminidase domain-containing protein, partial [Acetobacteraceae bacterium]